ncbi:transcriptional regulator [Paenibacillus glucanolyticus]|uniref:Transcriptional regulator n=1 Tax=Paenibacillus glucanolyticus TaxID=59843 RepID=A0A163MFJ9_9BACL|nr:transcriptional regulator [Paenibacillus glucanolyticus]
MKTGKLSNEVNLGFVKQRRLELGLSLQDMAGVLGFKNASTYMKYEEGSYAFKANHLPVLANKLECRIENFFEKRFAKIAKINKEVG